MKRFTCPVRICRRDLDGFYWQGLYLAYCPDICEVIAVGTTVEEALAEVTRELESAMTGFRAHVFARIHHRLLHALYPASVRDLVVELARIGLFRAKWTTRIHAEWINAAIRDRPELPDGPRATAHPSRP